MHPGPPVHTCATRHVLRTGEVAAIERKADLQCPVEGCPCAIESAVIAPLKAAPRGRQGDGGLPATSAAEQGGDPMTLRALIVDDEPPARAELH